jgi:tetratricopeptide (TPR) repeat protein
MRLLFLFGALTVAPTMWAQSSADPALQYRQAVDKQQAGDLAGAAQLYKEVLRQDPGNVAARSNLGAALAAQGHFDEAIPEYELALKGAPEQVRPYLQRNLALAYYKSGSLPQALPLLISLHEAQPQNRDAMLLAADCLLQLGEPAKALALLEPLRSQAAEDKALAWVIGNAYLRSGRTADGQRVLDPILKDTNSAEGNYALGMAMFTSGDYSASVKALARAIELDPALPHAQSFYGQALLFTGDPDAALIAFRKQLEADPIDFDANFQTAAILARRGAFVDAEPLLRRAVVLRPGSAPAHLALAEALTGQKKTAAARAELEATVRQWPDFGTAHQRLADLYTNMGLRTEAAQEQALAAKYTVKTAAPPGLRDGTLAPRFDLAHSDGTGKVKINGPVPGKPTVLVFGSYSCPNFRTASPALNEMSKLYAGKVPFLLVYIREAHATDQWQSTVNQREQVQLAPALSEGQKHEYAAMCERKLHLQFPSAVDGLDNAAEQAYSAWPSRVYVISADGRIRYSSGLTEQEFDRRALEKAVRSVIRQPPLNSGNRP